MIYLNETIGFINKTLQNRLSAYPTAEWNGISTPAYRALEGNGSITYPSIIRLKTTGAIPIEFKDNSPFIAYHKLNKSYFTNSSDNRFSDVMSIVNTTTDLTLVVIGWRKWLNIEPEQLALIITHSFPGILTAKQFETLGIKSVLIQEVDVNFDQESIIKGEFKGIRYFLGPEMFTFSIRYQIIGTYVRECVKECEC